jgi:hypothetical protein
MAKRFRDFRGFIELLGRFTGRVLQLEPARRLAPPMRFVQSLPW